MDIQDSVRGKNVYIVQVRGGGEGGDVNCVCISVQWPGHQQPTDGTAPLCPGSDCRHHIMQGGRVFISNNYLRPGSYSTIFLLFYKFTTAL